MERPMRIPHLGIPHDEGMPRVGPHTAHAAGQGAAVPDREAAQAEREVLVAVGFVVLEPDEWQSANIHVLPAPIGLLDIQPRIEARTADGIETKAVLIAFHGYIAREGIQA